MPKENLVIIVPGYELAHSSFSQRLIDVGSSLLGIDNNAKWLDEFADYVRSKTKYDAEVFRWNPGLTKRSALRPAAANLAELLKSKDDYGHVVLFSKSFGGIVAQLALEQLKEETPQKLIYVATPHRNPNPALPKEIEVINVYSKEDRLARRANLILHFSRVLELDGRVNIEIAGLRHSDFNHNYQVWYRNKRTTLYDLYVQLITLPFP